MGDEEVDGLSVPLAGMPPWQPNRIDSGMWNDRTAVRVTVSGSFTRYDEELGRTIDGMRGHGLQVLSPNTGTVEQVDKGFAYLHGDPSRNKRWTEDRHLEAIASSDFLWIINHDGYLGLSTAFEMGFARAKGIPIYAPRPLLHEPLGTYAEPIQRWRHAANIVTRSPKTAGTTPPLLMSPGPALDKLEAAVEAMRAIVANAGATLSVTQAERLRQLSQICSRILGSAVP